MPEVTVIRAVRSACAVLVAVSVAAAAGAGDPMRPDTLRAGDSRNPAPAPIYTVSAIFNANGDRVAVLNGKTVREGDSAGTVTVSAIEDDQVILATRQGPLVIQLNRKKTP